MTPGASRHTLVPSADLNGGLGPDKWTPDPPDSHTATVARSNHALYGRGYRAVCDCGWNGGWAEQRVHAANSAYYHRMRPWQ